MSAWRWRQRVNASSTSTSNPRNVDGEDSMGSSPYSVIRSAACVAQKGTVHSIRNSHTIIQGTATSTRLIRVRITHSVLRKTDLPVWLRTTMCGRLSEPAHHAYSHQKEWSSEHGQRLAHSAVCHVGQGCCEKLHG